MHGEEKNIILYYCMTILPLPNNAMCQNWAPKNRNTICQVPNVQIEVDLD